MLASLLRTSSVTPSAKYSSFHGAFVLERQHGHPAETAAARVVLRQRIPMAKARTMAAMAPGIA
jgi:hypothetical protein